MACDCQFSEELAWKTWAGGPSPDSTHSFLRFCKTRGTDHSWDPGSLTQEQGAGAFPGASLGKQRANPTLIRYPHSLPRATMVAFVGKYCMSTFFSTEEAFVRKRGHRNIAQSLGQKVGRVARWPALFWT